MFPYFAKHDRIIYCRAIPRCIFCHNCSSRFMAQFICRPNFANLPKKKKNSKWKCRAWIEIVDIIYDFNFLKSILGQIGFFLLFIWGGFWGSPDYFELITTRSFWSVTTSKKRREWWCIFPRGHRPVKLIASLKSDRNYVQDMQLIFFFSLCRR